ncbi:MULTISPECIES: LysR family transcriptional regulator [unclassified Chryseobacterium]|uniref:LysR family transcriptional regulator n=1 Tax=unclassified Chryseobacterium TaxID=2593645 RepID=UPI00100B4605|nr:MULTISPECIES: LysR family transcriptional regulator [unclassified Chryseobacterium]RXM50601.1 LysR family transcriptional regulator [Chryseobacterium sp. CH25]RXM63236.1 LysR family transcriptional regulator [Chryseobacterium sp. CH1]
MNTNDLKIFEAVAETGSFTKAASMMFTVQSNVTARIKSLEDEFDAKLFSRTSRKVELTSEGMILMQYCKQIQHLVEEAKHNIRSGENIRGCLKIGCIETTMILKAPEILKTFEEKYPNIELEFKSDTRDSLIAGVLDYSLDAAFVSAPIIANGLEKINIKEEQLVILTSSKGPQLQTLLTKTPLKIVVFDDGCIFRERFESWLSHKGVMNYKSTVLNSFEGIINFVEAGLGISILPEEIVSKYYSGREIKTYGLNKQLGTMNTVLAFRKDGPQSRALKCFIDMHLQS